jgi:hypothetical protein
LRGINRQKLGRGGEYENSNNTHFIDFIVGAVFRGAGN